MAVPPRDSRWVLSILQKKSQQPVECSRENRTTLFDEIKIFSRIDAIHLRFDRNCDYCLAYQKAGLETRMFGNGTASFVRRRATSGGGPQISTRTEAAFHLFLDRNFF